MHTYEKLCLKAKKIDKTFSQQMKNYKMRQRNENIIPKKCFFKISLGKRKDNLKNNGILENALSFSSQMHFRNMGIDFQFLPDFHKMIKIDVIS